MRRYVAVYKGLGGYATLGLEVVFAIVLSMLGGSWLDDRYATAPTFLWLGFAFGVSSAIWSVLRAVRMMKRETEREEREQGNPQPLYETDADRKERNRERDFAAPAAEDETR